MYVQVVSTDGTQYDDCCLDVFFESWFNLNFKARQLLWDVPVGNLPAGYPGVLCRSKDSSAHRRHTSTSELAGRPNAVYDEHLAAASWKVCACLSWMTVLGQLKPAAVKTHLAKRHSLRLLPFSPLLVPRPWPAVLVSRQLTGPSSPLSCPSRIRRISPPSRLARRPTWPGKLVCTVSFATWCIFTLSLM